MLPSSSAQPISAEVKLLATDHEIQGTSGPPVSQYDSWRTRPSTSTRNAAVRVVARNSSVERIAPDVRNVSGNSTSSPRGRGCGFVAAGITAVGNWSG